MLFLQLKDVIFRLRSCICVCTLVSSVPLMFAAIDPAGPFAAVCGITWVLMAPTSGVSALVSAGLCPFSRTAWQAWRLSRVAIWSGVLAFAVAVVATLATAGFETVPKESPQDAVVLIVLTGLAPLLGFFTGRWSQRKLVSRPAREAPASAEGGGVEANPGGD